MRRLVVAFALAGCNFAVDGLPSPTGDDAGGGGAVDLAMAQAPVDAAVAPMSDAAAPGGDLAMAPRLYQVLPPLGPSTGGVPVRLLGDFFVDDPKMTVTFDGKMATMASSTSRWPTGATAR